MTFNIAVYSCNSGKKIVNPSKLFNAIADHPKSNQTIHLLSKNNYDENKDRNEYQQLDNSNKEKTTLNINMQSLIKFNFEFLILIDEKNIKRKKNKSFYLLFQLKIFKYKLRQ